MNYTEDKAAKILEAITYIGRRDKIESIVKEIICDTSHKCAENIMAEPGTGDGYTILKTKAHSIAMNTKLD